MRELDDIQQMLDTGHVEEAIELLKRRIAANPADDRALYTLGNAYCRLNDWKHALGSYCLALEINPSSPAGQAYEKVQEILNFYCHDLYNP